MSQCPLTLKRESKAEMKRAEIFARMSIGIITIVRAHRTDRQFVAQADPHPVTHVAEPGLTCLGQKITGIDEKRALQFSINRKGVFRVHDREKFTANRVIAPVVRPEIALPKTAHGRAATIEKSLIDRNGQRLADSARVERIDDSTASAERERATFEPPLQWRP